MRFWVIRCGGTACFEAHLAKHLLQIAPVRQAWGKVAKWIPRARAGAWKRGRIRTFAKMQNLDTGTLVFRRPAVEGLWLIDPGRNDFHEAAMTNKSGEKLQ